MTFDPSDPVKLEAFLREQAARKREWDKLDFKQAWLKDAPGKRKPEIDQRAKMELIKDINAMANTFSLDFEDYGFLVLGVSRNEGKVTMDVPSLRDPGVDNLEAAIAEWLAEYMEPQPKFFLRSFEEPGLGTWGALVLLPNQSPPFVFSKEGTYKQQSGASDQLWREGEWRLRRNARTIRPGPLDYAHMLRTRIQSALEPLQREVIELRQQVSRLEGRMESFQQSTKADIAAALLYRNQPVTEVQFTTEKQGGEAVLSRHQQKIEQLRKQASTSDSIGVQYLETQYITNKGWYYLTKTFNEYLNPSESIHPDGLSELRLFMTDWNLDIAPEHRTFPFAGFYSQYAGRSMTASDVILGPDDKRARAYFELLGFLKGIMGNVKLAAHQAPFLEFKLKIQNVSSVSTGALRFELHCLTGASLYRYAPGKNGSAIQFVSHPARDTAQLLTILEESRAELLPGDSLISNIFALKFEEAAETVELELTVWAANLSEPKRIKLALHAHPKPSTT